jgi:hypothetical protein
VNIDDLKFKKVEVNGNKITILENDFEASSQDKNVDDAYKSLLPKEDAKKKAVSFYRSTTNLLMLALEEIKVLKKDIKELKAKKT